MGIEHLKVKYDTQLVVNQVNGDYVARNENMKIYLREVKALIEKFKSFEIEAIPRDQNQHADILSKFALGAPLNTLGAPPEFNIHYVERIHLSPGEREEILAINDAQEPEATWMTPIFRYFTN